MKPSLKKGFSFGLTSGIITTLGMMVGLNASTGQKIVVIGGILSIAIADSFSDALGIHISEETDKTKSHKQVWAVTIATFFSKLVFASSFIVPVLLFELSIAIVISILYGLSLLGYLSYIIAKSKKNKPLNVICEHICIAIVVIALTHLGGKLISTLL